MAILNQSHWFLNCGCQIASWNAEWGYRGSGPHHSWLVLVSPGSTTSLLPIPLTRLEPPRMHVVFWLVRKKEGGSEHASNPRLNGWHMAFDSWANMEQTSGWHRSWQLWPHFHSQTHTTTKKQTDFSTDRAIYKKNHKSDLWINLVELVIKIVVMTIFNLTDNKKL